MVDRLGKSDFKSMSIGDHLEELRARIILSLVGVALGSIVCLFFGRWLLLLIAGPFESAMTKAGYEAELQAISLAEKFLVYMKTSLLFGLLLSSPWVFCQLWRFVSAGLYQHERRFVYMAVPFCTGLFIAGVVFFMLVVAPIVVRFFVSFDTGIDYVKTRITFHSYINFIIMLSLVFGLSFQMPVAIIVAQRLGVVSLSSLRRARKYVLLALFIIAAVVTPPDVVSQISLGIPLYVLYEASIILCQLFERRKKRRFKA